MALSWRTIHNLPTLRNYKEAEFWERKTAPIRGDDEGTKPLGKRDQKYRAIARLDNNDIAVYIHGYSKERAETDWFIRYEPTGVIHLKAPRWSQKSTEGDFVGHILHWRWQSFDSRFWIRTGDGWLPVAPDKPNRFTVSEQGTVIAHDKYYPTTHVTNREGMREVRKQYQPFTDYLTGIWKLRVGSDDPYAYNAYTRDELCDVFGYIEHTGFNGITQRYPTTPPAILSWNFKSTHANELAALMRSEDAADQYKAYLWLVMSSRGHSLTPVKENITRIMHMAHYDQCLVKRVHTDGKLVRDRYRYAIPD